MLGLAEYRASSVQLLQIAKRYENNISAWIDDDTTKAQANLVGQSAAISYYEDYKSLLHDSMTQVAKNSVEHYSELLGVNPDLQLIEAIVANQYQQKYWGATLLERLAFNRQRMLRNVTRSSIVSPQAVTGILTKRVPFGAQYDIDRRVLLSTLSKIENDVARSIATSNDIKLMRWTLSHAHTRTDICDDLAGNVDKGVARYIEEHNVKISPAGVYFVDELPPPPHPNCQCEYVYVTEEGVLQLGALRRTFKSVTSLLRRLLGR